MPHSCSLATVLGAVFALMMTTLPLQAQQPNPPLGFLGYGEPIAVDPPEVQLGWRSVVNAGGDRLAVTYGHWNGPGETRIFDVKTGQSIAYFPNPVGLRGLAVLPDGEHFATGDFDGNFFIRNFSEGEVITQWKTPQGSVEMMSFSDDGEEVFYGSNADVMVRAKTKTGEALMVYAGHEDVVYDVAPSADQKQVASCASNGTILVHDVASGRLLHRISHPGQVASLHWIAGETKFASVASDGRLCVWDAETGKLLRAIDTGTPIFSIDITSDGQAIATGGSQVIALWNSETLEPLKTTSSDSFLGQSSIVFGVHFVGHDQLLSSGWDGKAILWDRNTGDATQTFERNVDLPAIVALETSADESITYAACDDGTLKSVDSQWQPTTHWQLPDGRKFATLERGNDGQWWIATTDGSIERIVADQIEDAVPVREHVATLPQAPIAMGQSSDTELLLAMASGEVILMDSTTGEIRQSMSLGSAITSAGWNAKTQTMLVYREDGILEQFRFPETSEGQWSVESIHEMPLPWDANPRVYSLSSGRFAVDYLSRSGLILDANNLQPIGSLPVSSAARTALLGSSDGTLLVTGAKTGSLSLYQIETPILSPLAEAQLPIKDLRFACFQPDGAQIRIGTIGCDFMEVNTKDLSPLGLPSRLPPFGMASSIRSADRKSMAIGSWGGEVVLLIPDPVELISQLPTEQAKGSGKAGAVGVSNDGKWCAVGTDDGCVRMYDVASEKLSWTSEPFGAPINEVVISPDGECVAATTGDYRRSFDPGLTVLLSHNDGSTLAKWDESRQMVTGVAFTADSAKVLACGGDHLRTYDVQSRTLVHTSAEVVRCKRVRFVDDHRCVVTSYPGQILLWDSATHRIAARYTGHAKPIGRDAEPMIWALDVSEDGTQFVTGDVHGQLKVWPIP